MPQHPRELASHGCIGYLRDGRPAPFEFVGREGTYAIDIQGQVHANDADVLRQLACAGQGIAALFEFVARDALRAGTLLPVLTQHPSTVWPIHALYPPNRHMLAKVRVFLDFLTALFRDPGRTHRAATARPKSPKPKGRPKRLRAASRT
jgi:DNA-binding transcriptional LysR family regulator